MSLTELFLIAAGLSMDAFAVAVCKGLSMQKLKVSQVLTVGLYFGGFQALMPFLGCHLGSRFADAIGSVDHWIAFFLLFIIGAAMVRESLTDSGENDLNASLDVKTMLMLSLATSIDAFAVGVTFALLSVRIVPAVSFIGIITFLFSCLGVLIGHRFGMKYKNGAERIGGFILILMGFKILLENYFF